MGRSKADIALARLTDPEHPAASGLAAIVVAQAMDRPLADVAAPAWVAASWADGLRIAAANPDLLDSVKRVIAEIRDRAHNTEGTVRDHVPSPLIQPTRELLGQAWSPSEDLTFRLLDQGTIRGLVREILTSGLRSLRSSVKNVDDGLLGGTVSKAARRGRGLLGGFGAVTGNFGGVASSVVGAVRDEVEGQFDARIRDHARDAAQSSIRQIAAYIANPEHAEAFGELRLQMLDVVLDMPVRELASEIDRMNPDAAAKAVVDALIEAAKAPALDTELTQAVQRVYDAADGHTIGQWAREFGVFDHVVAQSTAVAETTIRQTAADPAFEVWLRALLA